jgi:hypothetical protein
MDACYLLLFDTFQIQSNTNHHMLGNLGMCLRYACMFEFDPPKMDQNIKGFMFDSAPYSDLIIYYA